MPPNMTDASSPREQDRLATEIKFYATHKEEFRRAHSSEYVVIHGATILGFFQLWEQALRSGVYAFGIETDFGQADSSSGTDLLYLLIPTVICGLPQILIGITIYRYL